MAFARVGGGAGIRSVRGGAAGRVVRCQRARSPVAAHAGSLRNPRERGHAPADTGRSRRAALSRLARALADRHITRLCGRRGRHSRVAGAWIQPARHQASPRGTGRRHARLARRPHRASRGRPVHGRGASPLRSGRGRAARRRQHRARPPAHGRVVLVKCSTGVDGSRSDRLPCPNPTL